MTVKNTSAPAALLLVSALLACPAPVLGQSPTAKPPAIRTDFLGDPLPHLALFRIGTARLKHEGIVGGLAVSGDGRLLASSSNHVVRVWDARDGKPLHEFELPNWGPWALAFSADNKELAAASHGVWDGIHRWDIATGRKLQNSHYAPVLDAVNGVALSCGPGGKHIVAETRGQAIFVHTPATPSAEHNLSGLAGRVMCVALTRDGKTLVSLGIEGTIRCWSTADGKETAKLPAPEMKTHGLAGNTAAIAVAPECKTLAVSLPDASVRLLDPAGRELRMLAFPKQVPALTFSADGKLLFTCCSTIQSWNVDTGEEIPIVSQPRNPIRALALSPDGTTIACADDQETLRLVATATGKIQFAAKIPSSGGIAFAADNKHFATAGSDKPISLWEFAKLRGAAKSGAPAAVVACKDSVKALAFSPDSKRIATAEFGCVCRIYDGASGKLLVTVNPPGHTVFDVAFSPDGKFLASMGVQAQRPRWRPCGGNRHRLYAFGIQLPGRKSSLARSCA